MFTPPESPYRLKRLARLTAHLLDHMGYGEVDVLGVSRGGGLAQESAHRYPDRCRRLVLASTGAVMILGRLSVLFRTADRRRYRDPACMGAIAGQLYGGRLRSEPESELYLYNDGHLGLLASADELAAVVRSFLAREGAVS